MSHSRPKFSAQGKSSRPDHDTSAGERHDIDRKHRHKRRSHKNHSRHDSRIDGLRKLTKRVYNMVSEDRKQKAVVENPKPEDDFPTCGCPYNCGPELKKLRDYVDHYLPLFPQTERESEIMLERYVTNPSELLREVWKIIGPSHIRELVPDELLAVCSRREKRGMQHASSRTHGLSVTPLPPPFSSFDKKDHSHTPSPGLLELWRRCLFELSELSTEQVKLVLSGSDIHIPISVPSRSCDDNKLDETQATECVDHDLCDSHSPGQVVDSTSTSFIPEDRISLKSESAMLNFSSKRKSNKVIKNSEESGYQLSGAMLNLSESEFDHDPLKTRACQEITELEMRARLIRTLLLSKTKSKLEGST